MENVITQISEQGKVASVPCDAPFTVKEITKNILSRISLKPTEDFGIYHEDEAMWLPGEKVWATLKIKPQVPIFHIYFY